MKKISATLWIVPIRAAVAIPVFGSGPSWGRGCPATWVVTGQWASAISKETDVNPAAPTPRVLLK